LRDVLRWNICGPSAPLSFFGIGNLFGFREFLHHPKLVETNLTKVSAYSSSASGICEYLINRATR
jgi:hypothetical protein